MAPRLASDQDAGLRGEANQVCLEPRLQLACGRINSMCGIAGWLGSLPNCESHAARMKQAIHHRGPDASGVRSWPEATLIHTRLSIIDLSAAGAQPMANEDDTVWTVFNGEIYNHRDL